jgi:hypothetical protein
LFFDVGNLVIKKTLAILAAWRESKTVADFAAWREIHRRFSLRGCLTEAR